MTPLRTNFQDVNLQDTFQLEMEPLGLNGVPVQVLPPPEAVTLPARKTLREVIISRDTWHGVGRFLKKSAESSASLLTRTTTVIINGVSSLPWRDVGWLLKQAFDVGASVISGTVAFTVDVISALPWRGIGRFFGKSFKLSVSIVLDLLDFTIGRLLGFGILFDLGCALITAALWGKRGWWCLLEVLDITEQIDGFIPSCTLIALRSWNDN